MAASIVFLTLMVSTGIQAYTQDEPNAECFSASLKEEIRQFLREEIRQELGSVLAAVRADQAVMETNIVRRLNDTINNTIKEHNEHNNAAHRQYYQQNYEDRNAWGFEIKTTNGHLREIHPLVKSLLGNVTAYRRETTNQLDQMAATLDQLKGNAAAYRRETTNQLDQMATTLTQYSRETKNQLYQMAATLAQLKACLPSPCQNGGTCTPSADGSSYSCSCGPKVTGDNCENSEWIPHAGRLYYVSRTKCNYYTCRAECERLGADLITIESDAEQRFVASITTHHTFYLSIYETTGTVPGTWVVNQDSSKEIAYTNWDSTQPDAASSRCAVAYRTWGYRWRDTSCTGWITYYICEK